MIPKIEWVIEEMPYGKWAGADVGPIALTVRQVGDKFRARVLGANVDYDEPLVFAKEEFVTLEDAQRFAEAKAEEWLRETLAAHLAAGGGK